LGAEFGDLKYKSVRRVLVSERMKTNCFPVSKMREKKDDWAVQKRLKKN
jgi:hypothetical protein